MTSELAVTPAFKRSAADSSSHGPLLDASILQFVLSYVGPAVPARCQVCWRRGLCHSASVGHADHRNNNDWRCRVQQPCCSAIPAQSRLPLALATP
eukprot:16383-Heterococcus_DN1.PRE.2